MQSTCKNYLKGGWDKKNPSHTKKAVEVLRRVKFQRLHLFDTKTLIPFLDAIEEEYFELPEHIDVDADYGSEQNYAHILTKINRTPLLTYAHYSVLTAPRRKKRIVQS